MIDLWTLSTIVLMALVTYLTRISGYLVLGSRELSPRTMTMLDTAPGCVLIAVIAPVFVSGLIADLIALSLTMVAATRLPLLPTVLIGVASAGVARSMLS
ncbi:MAG: AzlD family protein [Sphingomonas sp.]|nr:MAG: AzlD family protein [Sphingomonas sp.]